MMKSICFKVAAIIMSMAAFSPISVAAQSELPERDWVYVSADVNQLDNRHLENPSTRYAGSQIWALLWDRQQKPGACPDLAPLNEMATKTGPSISIDEIAQLENDLSTFDNWMRRNDFQLGLAETSIPSGIDPLLGVSGGPYAHITTSYPKSKHHIFCQSEPVSPRARLHRAALTNRNDVLYVNSRWNDLKTKDGRTHEAYYGRLRNYYSSLRNYEISQTDDSTALRDHLLAARNYWVTTEGILPALAIFAQEEINGSLSYKDFENFESRIFYQPANHSEPYFGHSYVTVDKARQHAVKFDQSAIWYSVLKYLVKRPSELDEVVLASYTETNLRAFVDEFIDARDGDQSGMEYIFPHFMAGYALWPEKRFKKPGIKDRWMKDSFGNCEVLNIDETTPFMRFDMRIEDYSAKCIEINTAALSRGWYGEVSINIRRPAAQIDNLKVLYIDDENGKFTCFDQLKNIRSAPCLVNYRQYEKEDENIQDKYKPNGEVYYEKPHGRFYALGEMDIKVGSPRRTRLLLVNFPNYQHPAHHDVGPVAIAEDDIFEGSVSIDLTSVEKGWTGDEQFMSYYARKAGVVPPGPPPGREQRSVDSSIFDGDSAVINPKILGGAIALSESQLIIENNDQSLSFRLNSGLSIGNLSIGRHEGTAHFDLNDGRQSLQDPDKPSALNIIINNEDVLKYDLEAHVCLFRLSNLLQMESGKFCQDGEKRTVTLTGTIPFPKIWAGESNIAELSSDDYEVFKKLRRNRIQQKFQTAGIPFPAGNSSSSSDTNRGGSVSLGGMGGESGPQCSIRQSSGGCDCSCDAKSCLMTKRDKKTATSSDLSCRLTCGKKWKACP